MRKLLAARRCGGPGGRGAHGGRRHAGSGQVPTSRQRGRGTRRWPIRFPSAFAQPPTTAQCEQAFSLACYSPAQFQAAYDMTPLYNVGLTGRGKTICLGRLLRLADDRLGSQDL